MHAFKCFPLVLLVLYLLYILFQSRQINIGECLPKSCGVNGVRSILEKEKRSKAFVEVVDVRKVPGDYSLLTDLKVIIMG